MKFNEDNLDQIFTIFSPKIQVEERIPSYLLQVFI